MTDTDYQKALDAARKEIAELLPHHAAIEKRVAKLRQIIATLEAIIEDPDDDVFVPSVFQLAAQSAANVASAIVGGRNMPLSDAVREVLKARGKPMTSVDVRDGLIRMGIDTTEYTNALAVVHRALKRLEEKKEVKPGTSDDGKTTYKWIPQTLASSNKLSDLRKPARRLTQREAREAKEASEAVERAAIRKQRREFERASKKDEK
jgi:hypothetical protein